MKTRFFYPARVYKFDHTRDMLVLETKDGGNRQMLFPPIVEIVVRDSEHRVTKKAVLTELIALLTQSLNERS